MDDNADGRWQALSLQLMGGLNECTPGGRNVIKQDRAAVLPGREIRKCDLDLPISVPNFSQHNVGRTDCCGNRLDPLLTFFIGSDYQRTGDFSGDPIGQQGRGMQRARRNVVQGSQR
tara:strand:+ start:348 stop:698 length:351 start_codon:yes stop_codon:yes gene_type:complete